MGMRRNIQLRYDDGRTICFYTHWGADGLKEVLRNALIRGIDRWDDESYLARIIFSEMIKDHILENTGFGIAPYELDPEFKTIEVDFVKKTVDGVPFVDFIKDGKRCIRCGTELELETDEDLRKRYKYYCPNCDENMFELEVA